jgi:hypothetical protein
MKIKLKCTYSGNPKKPGEPGDVIDLPKDEAQRLVDLRAAEFVKDDDSVGDDAHLAAVKKLAVEKGVDLSKAKTLEEIEAALKAAGIEAPQA